MAIFGQSGPSGQQGGGQWYGNNRRRNIGGGLVIALVMAGFAICKYYSSSSYNDVTGVNQHVSISPDQEIELGLQSMPAMIEEFGGLHPDEEAQKFVKKSGRM